MMGRKGLPDDFPYRPGATFTIKEHAPPQPFSPFAYYTEAYHRPRAVHPRGGPYLTPLEWCLKYPLAETEAIEKPQILTLHIVDQVACKAQRTAQIVRCYLSVAPGKIFIAKIFDPVYFLPEEFDYTFEADMNYACEAAAYEDIWDAKLDGKYTPRYKGSWTFDLPVGGTSVSSTRPVRMVLLDEIQGYSMAQIVNKHLEVRIPPIERLSILAEVVEIHSKLEHIGVRHLDLVLRNVMLSGLDFSSAAKYKRPRVWIIDFNLSMLFNRDSCRFTKPERPRPVDPKTYLWEYCDDKWKAWVPEPHRSNGAAWRGWVRKLWTNKDDFVDPSRPSNKFSDRGDYVELSPDPDPEWQFDKDLPNYSSGEDPGSG